MGNNEKSSTDDKSNENKNNVINYGDKELSRHLFHVFFGREPSDEIELGLAESVGQQAANPRDALLRYFLLTEEFQLTNREFYSFFIDQMLRRRVFTGFRVPKVNLFCVGTSRAGTTTIARCLEKHSNVCISPVKETNYFSVFSDKLSENGMGENVYELYFPNWNKHKVIADFTPNYLSTVDVADYIYDYNKSSKVIIILRDPVERAISDFYYLKSFHGSDNILDFFEKGVYAYNEDQSESASWFSASKILRRGCYFNDVQKYSNIFTKQLKIIEFTKLNDIRNLLEELCEFIGIEFEENIIPRHGKERENASQKGSEENHEVKKILKKFYYSDIEKTQNSFKLNICDWI